VYCALLGPRLSGKTELLRFVSQTLADSLGWICAYVDLYETQASTLQGFFADLLRRTAERIEECSGITPDLPEARLASSAVFRGFLSAAVDTQARDLLLVIDHLEAIPTDLVQALLTSLRAAYMDLQTHQHQVMVIVSGALSLATMTVGESSPFRGIARRVFVGDLSQQQSEKLIADEIGAGGANLTKPALRGLLAAAQGDAYLIRRLCQRCLELAETAGSPRLRAGNIQQVTTEFLNEEVYDYAPLQEAVRLIEEDPDLLRCILLLLAHGTVPRAELPLPLSPDIDPLYLTGVVEQVGTDSYRVQNAIYREFLGQHFHSGRVGHLLTMAGRWDTALDYLEAGIREGNEQSRADLLPATINSIYASEDVAHGARFLTRALSAAFGVVDVRVWHAVPHTDQLRLVGRLGPKTDDTLWSSPEMPITADRLEARAFRQALTLRGREVGRHVWRAVPLLVPGQRPVGVVTLCDDLLSGQVTAQRERDLQLLGYLSQAARALQVVSTRRQELALAGRMQASLLPSAPPEIEGWQLAAVLRPARETSGDFYDLIPLPGDRLGILVADVADKGMGAALYMALSRTLIRTYASDYVERPDLALQAANDRILAETEAGLFVTVFYGILDPKTATLTYCNAGHHPPYLLSPAPESDASGTLTLPSLQGRGIALGVVDNPAWGHTTIPISPGAALIMYSDGVLDAQNPDRGQFGNDNLLARVQAYVGHSAQEIQEGLLADLQAFMGDEPQFDDITLLVVKREGEASISH
jgi:hypothetical protein